MMKPKHPIINGEKILKQYEKAMLSVTRQFTSAGGKKQRKRDRKAKERTKEK